MFDLTSADGAIATMVFLLGAGLLALVKRWLNGIERSLDNLKQKQNLDVIDLHEKHEKLRLEFKDEFKDTYAEIKTKADKEGYHRLLERSLDLQQKG